VISQLDAMAKLAERRAVHLIGDHLERSGGLHDSHYGCVEIIPIRSEGRNK